MAEIWQMALESFFFGSLAKNPVAFDGFENSARFWKDFLNDKRVVLEIF
jgi:hypothetical protein